MYIYLYIFLSLCIPNYLSICNICTLQLTKYYWCPQNTKRFLVLTIKRQISYNIVIAIQHFFAIARNVALNLVASYIFLYGYRSSNYSDSNSYCFFSLLKVKLFAIDFTEKSDNYRKTNKEKSKELISKLSKED